MYNISIAIEKLSQDTIEGTDAAKRLMSLAKTSPECREKIIQELLLMMNKPRLNFEADRASFFLWSKGASILGHLKATEALDVLIDHLNSNDGFFSASMAHHPAVRGVITMGVIAVPKLSDALRHNGNRDIRLAAALCLKEIGGQGATDALKLALKSESDQCVRRFIEPSFQYPTGEVLQERLLAFRCGN
jgi:hypothetical protein